MAGEIGLCTWTWGRLRTWVFEGQTQSQRRDVAQRAIGPGGGCERWGGGEKFSHGMVRSRKPPLLVPLHDNSYYTVPIKAPVRSNMDIQHSIASPDPQ